LIPIIMSNYTKDMRRCAEVLSEDLLLTGEQKENVFKSLGSLNPSSSRPSVLAAATILREYPEVKELALKSENLSWRIKEKI